MDRPYAYDFDRCSYLSLIHIYAAGIVTSNAVRITALKELIQHHVKEEESVLFPTLEDQLDEKQLETLGQRMQERFEEVVASGYAAALPQGVGKTSADPVSYTHLDVYKRQQEKLLLLQFPLFNTL